MTETSYVNLTTQSGQLVKISPIHIVAIIADSETGGSQVLTTPGVIYEVTETVEQVDAAVSAIFP